MFLRRILKAVVEGGGGGGVEGVEGVEEEDEKAEEEEVEERRRWIEKESSLDSRFYGHYLFYVYVYPKIFLLYYGIMEKEKKGRAI